LHAAEDRRRAVQRYAPKPAMIPKIVPRVRGWWVVVSIVFLGGDCRTGPWSGYSDGDPAPGRCRGSAASGVLRRWAIWLCELWITYPLH